MKPLERLIAAAKRAEDALKLHETCIACDRFLPHCAKPSNRGPCARLELNAAIAEAEQLAGGSPRRDGPRPTRWDTNGDVMDALIVSEEQATATRLALRAVATFEVEVRRKMSRAKFLEAAATAWDAAWKTDRSGRGLTERGGQR